MFLLWQYHPVHVDASCYSGSSSFRVMVPRRSILLPLFQLIERDLLALLLLVQLHHLVLATQLHLLT